MKSVLCLAIGLTPLFMFGQVTEMEKDLKNVSTDSVSSWKKGGVVSLTFGQASFKNWTAGGQNSINANALVSLYANYRAPKFSWDNSFNFGYGIVQQGINGSLIKTDDKIDLSSKYGRKLNEKWNYAALINFRTQATNGYSYPNDSTAISKFMAPGYMLAAIGLDYKPNEALSVFIAPVTSKMTFVNDQSLANSGAFGVEKATVDTAGNVIVEGKRFRSEFGGYMRLSYKQTVMENIVFQTGLDLFSNYLNGPQNIDVYWETLLACKINKYFQATLSTTLIYDQDINISVDDNNDGVVDAFGPRVQFKEVLGIGLSYKF